MIAPKFLKGMVESYKKYTKEDYDNIILKKERLILERNADLFPDGQSKLALEFYNTYESVKSKVGKFVDKIFYF